MALTPPNDIDYYRIKVGTNYVCVKNVHFCREMLEGNTSGFCKSCYETSSKGIYMLVDFGSEYTVCAKCTIDNCTKCNKYAGAVKGDTANYLECSECTSGVDKTQYMTDVNNYYLYPLTETVG